MSGWLKSDMWCVCSSLLFLPLLLLPPLLLQPLPGSSSLLQVRTKIQQIHQSEAGLLEQAVTQRRDTHLNTNMCVCVLGAGG